MKKMVLLVLVLGFMLVSCGGDDTDGTDSDKETTDNTTSDSATSNDDAGEVSDDEAEEVVVDFPAANNTLSFKINGKDAVIMSDKLADPLRTKAYFLYKIDEMFINYDSLSTENYALGFGLYKFNSERNTGDWNYYSDASGSREGDLTVSFMNRCEETGPEGGYGMGYFCENEWANEEFTVTITEYSGVGGKIAGTFSGTLIDGDCDKTVTITDGEFAFRRTEDRD